MSGISVNIIVLLLNGLPQSFLAVLALQIFTRTKIDAKKYVLLSLICILTTYLFRFLPIAIGVNTVLTLLILIVSFQFIYKTQLSKIFRIIVSAAGAFILIAFSEVMNMAVLIVLYGRTRAEELFNSSDGLRRSLYTTPSNLFFCASIFIVYFIIKKVEKKEMGNGEAGKKPGE